MPINPDIQTVLNQSRRRRPPPALLAAAAAPPAPAVNPIVQVAQAPMTAQAPVQALLTGLEHRAFQAAQPYIQDLTPPSYEVRKLGGPWAETLSPNRVALSHSLVNYLAAGHGNRAVQEALMHELAHTNQPIYPQQVSVPQYLGGTAPMTVPPAVTDQRAIEGGAQAFTEMLSRRLWGAVPYRVYPDKTQWFRQTYDPNWTMHGQFQP